MLIEGVEMDLGHRRYETFPDLYEYCIRVASAVGLICLEIFGYDDPRARQYATDLGVALQLTNILRDVPGDFAQGPLYIPLEDLQRGMVSPKRTLRQRLRPPGRACARRRSRRCCGSRRRGRASITRARAAGLPRGDARRLVAAEIMGAIYRASSTGSRPPTTTCSAGSSAFHGRSVR